MAAYTFRLTGDFDVNDKFTEVLDVHSNIVGFKRPDGSIVRLIVGLSVDDRDLYTDYTDEQTFKDIGFSELIYSDASFERE